MCWALYISKEKHKESSGPECRPQRRKVRTSIIISQQAEERWKRSVQRGRTGMTEK